MVCGIQVRGGVENNTLMGQFVEKKEQIWIILGVVQL
jgi:hypothetical protein